MLSKVITFFCQWTESFVILISKRGNIKHDDIEFIQFYWTERGWDYDRDKNEKNDAKDQISSIQNSSLDWGERINSHVSGLQIFGITWIEYWEKKEREIYSYIIIFILIFIFIFILFILHIEHLSLSLSVTIVTNIHANKWK